MRLHAAPLQGILLAGQQRASVEAAYIESKETELKHYAAWVEGDRTAMAFRKYAY